MKQETLDKLFSLSGLAVVSKATGKHYTAVKREAEHTAIVGDDANKDGEIDGVSSM